MPIKVTKISPPPQPVPPPTYSITGLSQQQLIYLQRAIHQGQRYVVTGSSEHDFLSRLDRCLGAAPQQIAKKE